MDITVVAPTVTSLTNGAMDQWDRRCNSWCPEKVGVKKIAFGNQTWQLKIPKKMDYQG